MTGSLKAEFGGPDLQALAVELRKLPDNLYEKHLGAAMKKAVKPGVRLLKNYTPKGPTGNLKRAVKSVTRKYRKTKVIFAAVGYSTSGGGKTKIPRSGKGARSGANLGYHQGLVEFGTKQRTAKTSRVMSSFATWNFAVNSSYPVMTAPPLPRGFMKSAPLGFKPTVKGMKGQKNIPRAFDSIDDFMEDQIRSTAKEQVVKAWKEYNHLVKQGRY